MPPTGLMTAMTGARRRDPGAVQEPALSIEVLNRLFEKLP